MTTENRSDGAARPRAASTHDAPRTHSGFVTEGQFVALELAMPDETWPIPEEASVMRLLSAPPSGRFVHGVTTGRAAHLFTGLFKGATGGVVQLGTLDTEPDCLSHLALPNGEGCGGFVLGFNHGAGFELMRYPGQPIRDVLQEPAFRQPTPRPLGRFDHAPLIALGPRDAEGALPCLTGDRVLKVMLGTGAIEAEAKTPSGPPAGTTLHRHEGSLLWLADRDCLGSWPPGRDAPLFVRLSACLPDESIVCARPRADGSLAVVLRGGGVFLAAPETKSLDRIAELPLAPVQSAAIVPDGRVYAMCGDELAHFARVDLTTGSSEPLGAVASALHAKRYGFVFGPSAVTREGTIFFGERDRRAHLWAYYPPLRA